MIVNILYILVLLQWSIFAYIAELLIWLTTVLFDRKRRYIHWFSTFWSRSVFSMNPRWRVEITGFENIPKDQPVMLISNHQHLLDTPLLLHLPLRFRFVGKKELFKVPVLGSLLRMRGDVAIVRGGVSSAKQMVKDCQGLLDRGISVGIFPEGTRTKTGEIGEFHTGAFLVVKRAKVPVLPVVITGDFDAMGKGTLSRKHRITLDVLPVISTQMVEELSLGELTSHAETIIKTHFKSRSCQN